MIIGQEKDDIGLIGGLAKVSVGVTSKAANNAVNWTNGVFMWDEV